MNTPTLWLTHFLRRRDLQQPDSRKLYGYRLRQQEYEDLRNHLRLWLGGDALDGGGHLAPGTTELFVLYGAAWWEREYAGGAWKWDEVITSFGGDPDAWPAQFRSQCIRVGLQFWKQRLGTSGKIFFGVLVEQGGLPRFLLARSKGNIYALIRALLKRAARLDAQCDEIAAMVSGYEDKLPRSLRNDEVYQLLAQVVSTVLDLKKTFRLTNGDNAVVRLDKVEPLWRERFPIALDDQAAIALLGDLVGEAAALETETRASPVIAERLLFREGDSYSLLSRLDLPKSIDAGAMARLGDFEEGTPPNRLAIELDLDSRRFVAVARKIAGDSVPRYALTVTASSWRGEAAMREHMLYVGSPDCPGKGRPLPGGMEMDTDSPWVFVDTGEESRLVAQGSTRLRQEKAQIVVGPDWTVDVVAGQAERLGQFVCGQVRRDVYGVNGEVTISSGAHVFHVKTRQMGIEADKPVWEGKRMAFATKPSLIFFNMPALWRYMPDGGRIQVPPTELEWRVAGTSRVIPRERARGPVDVLWRSGGELRLRTRMVILDKQPRFLSGESFSQGRIALPAAWGMDSVSCDTRALQLTAERHDDALVVNLTAGEEPPESIRLALDWKTCPVPCEMVVPFPVAGGRFFDRNGQRCAEADSIALDQLLGARLQVFDGNPNRPAYRLVFSLRCQGTERLAAPVAPIQRPLALEDSRAEVRLIDYQHDIESLMCLTDVLDAGVSVTLWAGKDPVASLDVRRYEFSLEPDGMSVALRSADLTRLSTDFLAQLQLHAVRLDALHDGGSVTLVQQFSEGVPTGRWSMPAGVAPVLWLAYPGPGAARSFRAVLLDLRREVPALPDAYVPAPETIREVLLIDEPHRRRDILARRLNVLCADFNHADWSLIEGAWTHLGHLALPTLDLWRALAKNADALSAFACREWTTHSPDDVLAMCERLHTELGVVWETVPLQAWYAAAGRLLSHWNALMPQPELQSTVATLVSDRLRAIRSRIPALDTALAFVTFRVTTQDAHVIASLARTPVKQLQSALWLGEHSAIQNLLLRNIGDRKPLQLQLYEDLVISLKQALPDAVFAKVCTLLWDPVNPRAGLANMPVLLALCSCNRWLRHWWSEPKRLTELRQYLDFERDWFRHAFNQTVAICIASDLVSLTDKKTST